MRFSYNTNGCSNHRLSDALILIAEAGYDGVSLTLDHHHLDPFAKDWEAQARALRHDLQALGLGVVIETGARYLLDPRAKHEPTLLNPTADGRARRVAFLNRAIDICAILDGEALSFFSGVPQDCVAPADARAFLLEGLCCVATHAKAQGVTIALEPEPGHLIATCADFTVIAAELGRSVDTPLTMALDTGHCLVTQDIDPAVAVTQYAGVLGTVAIEDIRRGVHEHLPFGTGDMDISGILAALDRSGFSGLVSVELSRESHRAHAAIPESLAYLRRHLPSESDTAPNASPVLGSH
ncbi:MAG: sugar phosphate isomerase/epimerase family protein [Candidatus Competibacteraceae bacterium]|nr:sugar phosphate isomerase/epimerase family protein [Candidatus Competibacteraceae bacterium]